MKYVHINADLDSWRAAARSLIVERVPPHELVWSTGDQGDLFNNERVSGDAPKLLVPQEFAQLAATVVCYDSPDRWGLLYRILYRTLFESRSLLLIESDSDVRQAKLMEKAIRRDIHKFHAFVRFRQITADKDGEVYGAWHEPQHFCVERATPFFARRFGSMRFSIFTPKGCAHWDKQELTFSAPASRSAAPIGDEMEELWRLYYSSIFNPFRLNVKTMKRELPMRHWRTLPEAGLIPELIRRADAV